MHFSKTIVSVSDVTHVLHARCNEKKKEAPATKKKKKKKNNKWKKKIKKRNTSDKLTILLA